MKKLRTTYLCQSCAFESTKWLGKCPNCGEWNTFVEHLAAASPSKKKQLTISSVSPIIPLAAVKGDEEQRIHTGIPEFDRVLGGGIVRGSAVLLGGDPGIGKSTLMLQIATSLASHTVLYITGEESAQQLNMRAQRLTARPSERLLVLAETNLELIDAVLEQGEPDLLIVDSIQTMYSPGLETAPGTVAQVREAAALFIRLAKSKNIPVFLIGHVTKEGMLAGPKVLEHMVDTVLQFEGERHHAYRIIRASKNRFGSTNEIGIFEMHEDGLREIENPSEVFLSERRTGATGSAVVAAIEGSRPLLLEVQALVAPTSYGIPQRTSTGFDQQRLQMLLAVLERRAGIRVGHYDIFVNIAGGVKISEPAVDLGMAIAIVSSLHDRPVRPDAVLVGEIGLGGEIRSVGQIGRRINEARKLGFRSIAIPRTNRTMSTPGNNIEILQIDSIEDAVASLIDAQAVSFLHS
jgi:DNA repair protein RadA/Sms